jgi:hypothetical protein
MDCRTDIWLAQSISAFEQGLWLYTELSEAMIYGSLIRLMVKRMAS